VVAYYIAGFRRPLHFRYFIRRGGVPAGVVKKSIAARVPRIVIPSLSEESHPFGFGETPDLIRGDIRGPREAIREPGLVLLFQLGRPLVEREIEP